MEAEALKQEIAEMISSMRRGGLLNEQFHQLEMLQGEDTPGVVMEILGIFSTDAEKTINNISSHLYAPVINFSRLDDYIHQMKGSSASVGAQKVINACNRFISACEECNREGCVMALREVIDEFLYVRSKFLTMIRLDKRIKAIEEKNKK